MDFIRKMAEKFLKLHAILSKRRKQITAMAAVVVFITTYALTLPAISLDTTLAGMGASAPQDPAGENAQEADSAKSENAQASESGEQKESSEATSTDEDRKEESSSDAESSAEDQSNAKSAEKDTSDDQKDDDAEEEKLITDPTDLTFEGKDYTITAHVDADAVLPAGTRLDVTEITEDDDRYEAYHDSALEEIKKENTDTDTLSSARFFDITFKDTDNDDTQVEPSTDIKVTVKYDDAITLTDGGRVAVVHFDDKTGDPEILDTNKYSVDTHIKECKTDTVEFKNDAFSVYGIVAAEPEADKTLAAEGDGYKVTISYDKDAGIPDGTTLSADTISEDSDDYKNAKKLVAEARDVEEDKLGLSAFNISLLDENGDTVEPDGDVTVKFEVSGLPEEASEVAVHHVTENGAADGSNVLKGIKSLLGNTQEKDTATEVASANVNDGKADVEFTTGSFSPFTVSWVKTLADEGSEVEETTPDNAENIRDYITQIKISYRSGDSGDWTTVSTTAKGSDGAWTTTYKKDSSGNLLKIPADASVRTDVSYSGVHSQDLKNNHSSTLYYQDPSDFLTNFSVQTEAMTAEGSTSTIGTIRVDEKNKKVIMNFTDDHLSGDASTIIYGSFWFMAEADRSTIRQNPTRTLKVGDATITVTFEDAEDIDARLGTLDLQKSTPKYVKDSAGNSYLEYTLTLSTGEYAMPDVHVEDSITRNASYVDSYVGVTTTEQPLLSTVSTDYPYETITGNESATAGKIKLDSSKMIWTIGQMSAHETRTLTYRLKLESGYVGIKSQNWYLDNTATPFSKTFEHKAATSEFSPSTDMTISKTAGTTVDNGDTISIPYTLTVTASQSNTWTLSNIKIADNITATLGGTNIRDLLLQNDHENFSYNDFKIYDGSDTTGTFINPTSITGHTTTNPIEYYSGSGILPRFDLYIGDMAPGAVKTITYNVVIKKTVFAAGNGALSLTNNAGVYSDDSSAKPIRNQNFSSANSSKQISFGEWDRKLVSSSQTSEDITQAADSAVYTYNNGTWSQNESADRTKTIPAGSYQYQVLVNEAGAWNVSSAIFGDQLSNRYLSYKGFLRVDYYENSLGTDVTPSNDQDAISKLKSKEITKTFWLDIDDLKNSSGVGEFSLTPTDLDKSLGKGAYILTYYAAPSNTSGISQMNTNNTFKLSGPIGYGSGGSFTISGISVHKSVSFEGDNDTAFHKSGWYFDFTDKSGNYNDGRLYWVIAVSGSNIPSGTQIRDTPDNSNNSVAHLLYGDSLVGAYKGTGISSFSDSFATIDQVRSSSALTDISNSVSWAADNTGRTNSTGTITFNDSISLQKDETIYLIIVTNPLHDYTTGDNQRSFYDYTNRIASKDNGSDTWIDRGNANLRAMATATNWKEGTVVAARDENGNWTTVRTLLSGNNVNKIPQAGREKATEPGLYIVWNINLNFKGDLKGKYRVTDQLPDGLKAVYVRYFYNPTQVDDNPPTVPEISGLGSEWADIGLKNAPTDNNKIRSVYAYYNESTGEIQFDAANLQNGGVRDQYSLQIQVLTKITDPDVTLGNQVKTYTNHITVTNDTGTVITSSDATAQVEGQTKSIIKTAAQNIAEGKLAFTIKVNPYGQDLISGSDTLTLVDEMDSPLQFDPSNITVKDSKNNDVAFQMRIERTSTGQRLTLTVPDSESLTISYSAAVNTRPDTEFTVHNKAYWYGYSESTSEILKEKQTYQIAGTGGKDQPPSVRVEKRDADDAATLLPGAEFTLQKAVLDTETGKYKPDSSATSYTLTTDKNGAVTFDTTNAGLVSSDYNATVFCIWESKAPANYELDDSKHYFVIAKANTDGTFPDTLKNFSDEVYVSYAGTTYTYIAYDTKQKGEISVKKAFKDKGGEDLTSIPDGTYSFGLFEGDSTTWSQKLNIIYKDGTLSYAVIRSANGQEVSESVTVPKFTGLDLNTQYSVYELDSNGNRVDNNGTKYLDGMHGFKVTYSGNTNISFTDKTADVKVTNTVLDIKLVLKKTDTTATPLTGAEFTIQKKNEKGVWEASTNVSNGKITISDTGGFEITGLTTGTYKLVETKAPDGYIITSTGDMEFTVTDTAITMDTSKLNDMVTFSQPTNGEITYTITVKNQAGTALPNTGGSGTGIFYLLGLMLVFGAGIFFLFHRKRV